MGRTVETRELNHFLNNIKIEISDAYDELVKEGRYIIAQLVNVRYLGTDNHDATLIVLIEFHIEKTEGVLKWNTLKNYYTTKKYVNTSLSKKCEVRISPWPKFIDLLNKQQITIFNILHVSGLSNFDYFINNCNETKNISIISSIILVVLWPIPIANKYR